MKLSEEIERFIREGEILVSQGEVRPGIVQGQHWARSIRRQEADFWATMAIPSTALPQIISVTPYRVER